MKNYALILSVLINILLVKLYAQTSLTNPISFHKIDSGLYFAEINAPIPSIIGNSKISILKIEPQNYSFHLYTASEYGKTLRTARQWADTFNLNAVFNAGMYSYKYFRKNIGYMKNYKHYNNKKVDHNLNGIIAFNPKKKNIAYFKIYDLSCHNISEINENYNTIIQGMRMIDCKGNAVSWNRNKKMISSIIAISTDVSGNVILFFTRSPYNVNDMISFMMKLPLNINSAVYLEGGPETSLAFSKQDTLLDRFGSYVSVYRENDTNTRFFRLPNVIGIKKQKP